MLYRISVLENNMWVGLNAVIGLATCHRAARSRLVHYLAVWFPGIYILLIL